MKDNVILVTGGTGFIGCNFVKQILKHDNSAKIIVLDALTYAGNLNNLLEFLNNKNIFKPKQQIRLSTLFVEDRSVWPTSDFEDEKERIRLKLSNMPVTNIDVSNVQKSVENILSSNRFVFVNGNIVDHNLVSQLMPLCNVVVNFAAETHVDRSILNPNEFIKTDVYGTYVLLEAARKCSTLKKFVHISTDEVYGEATEKSFKETDAINPRNPYSASKAAADRLVYAYNQTYGLPINIVRPSNNFGPYQYPEKLIPVMIIKALKNEPLPVYGDGKQIRDWLFVEDTVRAIELVINKAKSGEVYNIAGRNERENIEVVKRILSKLGKPESLIKHVKDRPGHDRRYSLDDSKIRNELGFKIEGTFEEKLDSTIQWYLDNQKWWQKIINEDKDYEEFMKSWYSSRK